MKIENCPKCHSAKVRARASIPAPDYAFTGYVICLSCGFTITAEEEDRDSDHGGLRVMIPMFFHTRYQAQKEATRQWNKNILKEQK